jgi:hypothetical protein
MNPAGMPVALLLAAGLLGLLILMLLYLLVQWVFQKRKGEGPELPPPSRDLPRPPTVALQPESIGELCRRIEDALVVRLGRQTEAFSDLVTRLQGELLEVGCKVDVLSDAVRQNSKEIALNEQLLNDIAQILNISISESKAIAQKLQKFLDEPQKPLIPSAPQRLNQIR